LKNDQSISLKKDFYKFCEKEYFYGYVEDEAYDLFNEVVSLELDKEKL